MEIRRIHLYDIHKCYVTTAIKAGGELKFLFATEDKGPCYSYNYSNAANDHRKKETVWEGPGGTMSIVEIPGKQGEFLAVQKFFPTFNASEAQIVWGKYVDGCWEVSKFIDLPYIHRLDLLHFEGVNYFVGGTLCTSKKDLDDWSNPGKILVGVLPNENTGKLDLMSVQDQLTRHHGYSRGYWKGKLSSFFTADEGVYILTPSKMPIREWKAEKLLNRRISDISVFDLDGDGEDELVTIEPFHGNAFCIYKKIDREYHVIYQYPHEVDFLHVVWAGLFNGIPTVFGGVRRMNKELFMIRYNKDTGQYDITEIEYGGGPSNIFVVNQEDGDLIMCANRERGQAVVYKVKE